MMDCVRRRGCKYILKLQNRSENFIKNTNKVIFGKSAEFASTTVLERLWKSEAITSVKSINEVCVQISTEQIPLPLLAGHDQERISRLQTFAFNILCYI